MKNVRKRTNEEIHSEIVANIKKIEKLEEKIQILQELTGENQ